MDNRDGAEEPVQSSLTPLFVFEAIGPNHQTPVPSAQSDRARLFEGCLLERSDAVPSRSTGVT